MKVFSFVSLLLVFARAGADDEVANVGKDVGLGPGAGEGPGEPNERPRVLCGRVLADARMLYCLLNNEPQKRSGSTPSLYQRPDTAQDQSWNWISAKQAAALRGKRDHGLVDECCLKPCYISELLNYC